MNRARILAALVLLGSLASCSQPQQQQAQSPPPAAGEAAKSPGAPTEARQPALVFLPAGTRVEVRLSQALSSAENKAGDAFDATLDKEIVVDGKTVIPRDTDVIGKVASAIGSGRVKGRAKMSINLTEIRIAGKTYPIRTNILTFVAQGTQKQDAVKVGAGAAVGAVIGALAGGGKGAAIGAAAGGGAGTGVVLATKGKEVKFAPEQNFSFVLREDLKIPSR